MKSLSVSLDSLINSHESPAVVIDANYQIIAANQAYCDSYGIAPQQVIGRTCHEVSHRSTVPCHQNGESCPHQRVFATGQPFEVLHTHFDHTNKPDFVRIKAYPISAGNGTQFIMEHISRLAPCGNLDKEVVMVGQSPAFLSYMEALTATSKYNAPLLLQGETGVGKELAARYTHEHSPRKGKPYVSLNCASIPEALFESELFGHERGAFTGSVGTKQGLFELAEGGSLFLDEISELSLAAQAKLLRVLDTGEYRRVGGKTLLKADVRLIAASNQNLYCMIAQKNFREDLYYRVASIKIAIPPLRERALDVPLLAHTLMARLCQSERKMPCQITRAAMEKLSHYHFPGNIRELRNILHRAIILSTDGVVDAHAIEFGESAAAPASSLHACAHVVAPPQADITRTPPSSIPAATPDAARNYSENGGVSMSELESSHISKLLEQCDGNRRKVAQLLGIHERTLYRKIKRFGLSAVA